MKCPSCGHVVTKKQGLKGRVRELHFRGLTVKEIVGELRSQGYFDHYTSNPAISVHGLIAQLGVTPHKRES